MVTIRRCVKEDEPAVLELISGIMSREFKDAATAYPLEDVERISSAYGGLEMLFRGGD